jgi:hypothetical protein
VETILLLALTLQIQNQNPVIVPLPTPDSELALVRADFQTVQPQRQQLVRYITSYCIPPEEMRVDIVKLDDKGYLIQRGNNDDGRLEPITESQVTTTQQVANLVASMVINSLSLKGQIIPLETVPGSDGRIARFYLDDYGIRPDHWDNFANGDDHFRHLANQQDFAVTLSYRPLIRTDFVLANAMYEPHYSNLLYSGVKAPKTEKEFVGFFKFNIAEVRSAEKDKGAVCDGFASLVAYNKRKLRRYTGILGDLHITDDFLDNVDKQEVRTINGKQQNVILLRNPSENLLIPNDPHVIFDPDGGELIVRLPNELQAYCIVNKQRQIIAKADTELVRDTKMINYDTVVRTGASCVWCHLNGINVPGNDNFATIGPGKINELTSYKPEAIPFLQRFYGSDYSRLILDDQQKYIRAVARANGMLAADNGNRFREFVTQHKYTHLTAEQAARELGVQPDRLHAAVSGGTSKDLNDLFAVPPILMPRQVFEQRFQTILLLLKGTNK